MARAKSKPATAKKPAAAKRTAAVKEPTNGKAKRRLWLMYPPRLITNPVIWEVGHKFRITTNVRQASVTDEIGIVCLEIEGDRAEIKSAIQWLEKQGISVEPVEINVIES